MTAAIKFNPHVVELLLAGEPPMFPERYALGSPEEAATTVIEEQLESWTETEGFIEWMFARFAAWERERDKKRKLRAKNRKPKKSRK